MGSSSRCSSQTPWGAEGIILFLSQLHVVISRSCWLYVRIFPELAPPPVSAARTPTQAAAVASHLPSERHQAPRRTLRAPRGLVRPPCFLLSDVGPPPSLPPCPHHMAPCCSSPARQAGASGTLDSEGQRNVSPQMTPPWQADSFEAKAVEEEQKSSLTSPYRPESGR